MNEAGGNAPMCLGGVRGPTGGTQEARDQCPKYQLWIKAQASFRNLKSGTKQLIVQMT